jgi:coenzyme F420-reducing hydrogenase alpha subunit
MAQAYLREIAPEIVHALVGDQIEPDTAAPAGATRVGCANAADAVVEDAAQELRIVERSAEDEDNLVAAIRLVAIRLKEGTQEARTLGRYLCRREGAVRVQVFIG